MPSKEKPLVTLKGSAQYAQALDLLYRRSGATSLSELTDRALRLLAQRHGIELPERIAPVGTNRYTA